MILPTCEELIKHFGLKEHPEGGLYARTYSGAPHPLDPLARAQATSIIYLLRAGEVSQWHRLQSDELWFFHLGGPLEIVMLGDDGAPRSRHLGCHLAHDQAPQLTVPKGTWFAARVLAGVSPYSLVSCVVSPGFEFAEFQLASHEDLGQFPGLAQRPEFLTTAVLPRI